MEDRTDQRIITVARVLTPTPFEEFIDAGDLYERLATSSRGNVGAERRTRSVVADHYELEVDDVGTREVSAVADVRETIEPQSDQSEDLATLRASAEALPLLRQLEEQDPSNRLYKYLQQSRRAPNGSSLAAQLLMERTEQVGEVVRLDRVHQPVPVVAGAVPAQEGSKGALTAEFERSKSGAIEVKIAAAGGSFSVKYSIADTRSVELPESASGELVVGLGCLLIPLDRQVTMVPMVRGGEVFPVVRYLPVRGAADLIGWDASAGDASDVEKLSLRGSIPLVGTRPQKGSRQQAVSVDATVSLGWEHKPKSRSVKASLGVSANVKLGVSWELPPGQFDLKWAERRVVGAVIR